jgi:non-ribosomal peptide synthetase component E (peptide arylation enzyme)
MTNLSRLVRHHALRNPDRIALVHASDHISYGHLWHRIGAIAAMHRAGLAESGR